MTKLPSISSSSSSTSVTSSQSHSSRQHEKDMKYLSEFHEIQRLIKSTISTTKYSLKNEFGQILSQANKSDLCHDDWEAWALKHGKKLSLRYTTNEIRQLRKWFLELDTDGSGEVSYHELVDPLLSSGIMKSKEDVKHLIEMIDTKGSGEINFYEFLNLLNDEKFCQKKKIKVLQNITRPSVAGLSTAMRLSQERRKHLLSTVIDEAAKRQEEMDQLYLSHPSVHSTSPHHESLSPPSLSPLSPSPSACSSSVSSHQKKKKLKPEKGNIFESKLEKVALSHHKQVM
jgi:hypothetical protein